ncbi:hypothetical protein [Prosthecobacter dejongeii]|uniref:Uncharacterized protein n=1 Tax=Prosthecobacter dejongeii TaxID=48465 RepID=A0A7W8DNM6_9BACT|nr:hypothetical protein [Prosthecobacter dejongeii]MBB5036543.1 hypothetical protein [Prosthecobacter dejongeii]
MALRIHTAITHGEIDNTERGRVRGRLWLIGREEPVELDLDGDAWRDVAGTRVSFVNPTALPQPELRKLNRLQHGVVGDITASRRVKVFTVPEEEWQAAYREDRIEDVPTEWRNSLYLEWFTAEQGRCVVESADLEITISEHVWEMDEDEEGAQKLANMQAMRDFLAAIIQRPEETENEPEDDEGDLALTEEQWEEQLQASDRLADASMEAYEKYGEDEDADEKTAFVMGWDHLLEDMADAQEGVQPSENDSDDKKRRREWAELMNQAAEDVEHESWKQEEKDEPHPLKDQSHQYLVRLMSDMRATGLNKDRGDDPDHPLDRFMSNVMQVSGKLAAALHSRRDLENPMDRGYVLAITKRCLNWIHEALAALQDLHALEDYASHRRLIETWREGALRLRNSIADLREELTKE